MLKIIEAIEQQGGELVGMIRVNSHLFVVLAMRLNRYVTWIYNSQDGGLHHGHYEMEEHAGREDFVRRLTGFA